MIPVFKTLLAPPELAGIAPPAIVDRRFELRLSVERRKEGV
jgi:hypothetical protein